MLEKEVKQYKRGNSFTYRIDLSKKDNFEGGEKVMILRISEYESYLNEIDNLKAKIDDNKNTISDLKQSRSEADSSINEIMEQRNQEISEKNKEIMDLVEENKSAIAKCYEIIDEKDQLIITGRKKNIIVLSNGKNIYPWLFFSFYLFSIRSICANCIFQIQYHEICFIVELFIL